MEYRWSKLRGLTLNLRAQSPEDVLFLDELVGCDIEIGLRRWDEQWTRWNELELRFSLKAEDDD
jgi:hypothetical protein